MRCQDESDPKEFAADVLPWLTRDPVIDNVIFTVIAARVDGLAPVGDGDRWIRVLDGPDLVGVASWTPPYGALLSAMPAAAAEALADHFAALRSPDGRAGAVPPLPGVSGPAPLSDAFADRYQRHVDVDRTLGMDVGVFRLDRVVAPPAPGGALREARSADLDLLLRWSWKFQAEAVPHQAGVDPAPAVERRLRHGGLTWLWEDGEPVTLVSMAPPAAGVARIAPVYTPPEHRGRGYASAATAAVSQLALDRGARAVMLNTDLANPTSNRIYQRIGFNRVGDAREWLFHPAGTA